MKRADGQTGIVLVMITKDREAGVARARTGDEHMTPMDCG